MPHVARTFRLRALLALALGCAWLPPAAAAEQSGAHDRALAETTFDFVWTRIRDTYYDPDMRGLDWEAVRAELRPRAIAAATLPEFRTVLGEMLGRLGESHFSIIPGAAGAFEPGSGPAPGDADVGLDLRVVDGDLLVTRIRPGGPADRAGVRPGWMLDGIDAIGVDSLEIEIRNAAPRGEGDRQVALWLPPTALRWTQGAAGSSVRLRFRDGSGDLVTVAVSREPSPGDLVRFGNLPPIRVLLGSEDRPLPTGGRVAIVRWSAWFPTIVPRIAEVVDAARGAEGIVIDLRGNPGGLGALVMGIGGHFLDEPVSLGAMRTRETELRFVVNPQRVTPDGRRVEPYAGPVAVLVDALTASTSEFFAGGLQALGRARVFGEPTAGQALPAVVVELPNGDRMMHVLADFTGPDGIRLEGSGVRPDVLAPPTRAALLAGEDPALDAAIRWIDSTKETGR